MRTLFLLLVLASAVFAAEAPPQKAEPASTEVLELRKALFESQMQNLGNAKREAVVFVGGWAGY